MPKIRKPDEAYSGRRFNCQVLNITIDTEAALILRRHCAQGNGGMGRFVARLLYEYEARLEERQRVRVALQPVLEESIEVGE